jgi:hemerythrin
MPLGHGGDLGVAFQCKTPTGGAAMADHLTWQDHFSVGIAEIDEDHKKLVAILNGIVHAVHEGHGKEAISAIFTNLLEKTAHHFAFEESLMDAAKYPAFTDHRDSHEHLIDKLKVFHEDFRAERIAMLGVVNFLVDWFSVHVMREDAQLGRFLREQGFEGTTALGLN